MCERWPQQCPTASIHSRAILARTPFKDKQLLGRFVAVVVKSCQSVKVVGPLNCFKNISQLAK